MVRPIVLASRSPRRADLLEGAEIAFDLGPFPDVDESVAPGERPADAVRRLAEAKARAVVPRAPGRRVLAADTLVFLGLEILGKPRDEADARRMLRRLSGGWHAVATGVAVGLDDVLRSGVAVTRVRFRALADEEIDAYVATGEPLDKAGAYGIQAGAASFVEALDGEVDTVIGLPLSLVRSLLRQVAQHGGAAGR